MEHSNLKRLVTSMKQNLFDQGYLDEQFYELENLEDDISPNFVEEVVNTYFKHSSRLMTNIERALETNPGDFHKLDSYMQQFKGSSSSIGASKLKNECLQFHEKCEQENIEGCRRSFQKVKSEHGILKQKLEAYFQLLRQVGPGDRATSSN
ncbi:histidine-containing phosphotransfer peotein protein [Dioscorea alata]|uniref:Histidine-containing phosphotransfer peotein protein n=1 Tax=Dioscorea alata TaxID=55571 RepID=A0ACB7UBM6_DIOAL|nr:histidine-containing phosphotransfer peotein protein [Dioscorea alata]